MQMYHLTGILAVSMAPQSTPGVTLPILRFFGSTVHSAYALVRYFDQYESNHYLDIIITLCYVSEMRGIKYWHFCRSVEKNKNID